MNPASKRQAFLVALIPLAVCAGAAALVTDSLAFRWLCFVGVVGAIALGVYWANRSADSNTGF